MEKDAGSTTPNTPISTSPLLTPTYLKLDVVTLGHGLRRKMSNGKRHTVRLPAQQHGDDLFPQERLG